MSEASEMSIYEKKFAKSEDTDSILVVEGKKLHVNKALLSCHSAYFKALFNSDFKEKSMEEIPIEDVNFEDFATLLSLIHPEPFKPMRKNAEKLLDLADRFIIPAAKIYLEIYLIASSEMENRSEILKIGDKYHLDFLIERSIKYFGKHDKNFLFGMECYKTASDSTKIKLLTHMFFM